MEESGRTVARAEIVVEENASRSGTSAIVGHYADVTAKTNDANAASLAEQGFEKKSSRKAYVLLMSLLQRGP